MEHIKYESSRQQQRRASMYHWNHKLVPFWSNFVLQTPRKWSIPANIAKSFLPFFLFIFINDWYDEFPTFPSLSGMAPFSEWLWANEWLTKSGSSQTFRWRYTDTGSPGGRLAVPSTITMITCTWIHSLLDYPICIIVTDWTTMELGGRRCTFKLFYCCSLQEAHNPAS